MHIQTTSKHHRALLWVMALFLAAGYPAIRVAALDQSAVEPQEITTQVAEASPSATAQSPPAVPATTSQESTVTVIEPVVNSEQESQTTVVTQVTAGNNLTSTAVSGDATVTKNTTAGNATTGSAAATATLLTLANSSITTGGDNAKIASITKDIYGDVKGDIVLYPMLLKAMLEAEANQQDGTTSTALDAQTAMSIDNTISLDALSGDASVTTNTTAGSATSGSATAVANVVNVLNSMIASQQSFVGTINIYGNLEGDILIAPDFIPQMIANNGGDPSSVSVSSQDTQTIVNNISAIATSGAATVVGNTTAGNATTGEALSNVVLFNLSGHEIVASNSLLVFVNVLGKWVGVIVDAPAGTTAAMIGSNVSTQSYAPDLVVTADTTQSITNTIAVTARSGDANVAYNTTAGNATTGDAKAMVNVANITGSQVSLAGWFGILFINVFQNWYGSFGVDTAYGNSTDNPEQVPGPIRFVPKASHRTPPEGLNTTAPLATQAVTNGAVVAVVDTDTGEATIEPAVLSASISTRPLPAEVAQQVPWLWLLVGLIVLVGAGVLGVRYALTQR